MRVNTTMRSETKRKRTILMVALLGILVLCSAINYVFDPFIEQVDKYPDNLGDFSDSGSYTISPETILPSLVRGEADVFMPQLATPEVYTTLWANPVPPAWGQSDYLNVVGALHQFVWHETLADWKLYSLELDTSCKEPLRGFGIGDFVYYKSDWINGRIVYEAREMSVHPLDNDVSWGGGTIFPHPIFGWKGVNLETTKITAEDALKIAELNGGGQIRSSLNNDCMVRVGLSGSRGWYVLYVGDGVSVKFAVQINPETGRIE